MTLREMRRMRANIITICTESLPVTAIELYIILTWERKMEEGLDPKMSLILVNVFLHAPPCNELN